MITNKILQIIIAICSFLVVPVQMVTTLVLGFILSIFPFGLLLIPLSFVWVVLFLGPLIGLSYVYEKVKITRPFIALIGIPLAVVGDVYVCLLPTFGEFEGRFEKLILCQTFPYTWKFTQVQKGLENINKGDTLGKILKEISKTPPLKNHLNNLRVDIVSRPENLKSGYRLDW